MGNEDSNSHSRGGCHHTIPGRTADTSGGVEKVSKGRKDKRLGGETPLRLQKSVLFLGNYHTGLAKQPHVTNEERNLGGWLPERNSCLETH